MPKQPPVNARVHATPQRIRSLLPPSRVRAEVVYQCCVVFPDLAVVGAVLAGVLEVDVDDDDALGVGAVDAGADGGLRFPD
jgi:hypothetical protein